MAVREFSDTNGVLWRVWQTRPSRDIYLGKLREGWLTFECGTERRRLAPVPEAWDDVPIARLELMLRVAERVETRQAESDVWSETTN